MKQLPKKSKIHQRAQRAHRSIIRIPNDLYHAIKLYQQNQEIPCSFNHCLLTLLSNSFKNEMLK